MRCPKRLERRRDSRGLATEALERRQCLSATISVTLAEPTVIEGETHVATIRLSRPLAQVERVMVSTADRTASFGRDYFRMMSEQIIFMPGETAKSFTIATLRDTATEGVETFQITATPVNPRIRATSTLARIGDYTAPPLMTVAGVTVTEGASGFTPAIFTLALSAPFAKAVSVNYATRDGSATVADNDYQATSGRLTFAPGETTKTVTVNVVGDRRLEPDETFGLLLSSPANASLRQSTATGTIRNDEGDLPGYQITLDFITSAAGEVPQSIRELAAEAAAKWSRVIVGDLPSVEEDGEYIDDMLFRVQMGLLGGTAGGPGGVLANAAPLSFRDGGRGLPYEAITGIDPADASTNTPADRAFLLDVLVHEIGHGLGFTDNADVFGRYVNGAMSVFTGPNTLREYNTAFGVNAGGVPLQPNVLAHWDETVFVNEIMTPQIAAPGNPLSRITVGALQDMGYVVNYSAAETYRPRQSPPRNPATGTPQRPGSRPPAQPPSTRPGPNASNPASASSERQTVFKASMRPFDPDFSEVTVRRPSGPGTTSINGLPLRTAIAALANLSDAEPGLPRKGIGRLLAVLTTR